MGAFTLFNTCSLTQPIPLCLLSRTSTLSSWRALGVLLMGGVVHTVLFPAVPMSAFAGPLSWPHALATTFALLLIHVCVTQFHRRLWPLVLAASRLGNGVNMILLASFTPTNPTVWETLTEIAVDVDKWVVVSVAVALAAGLFQGWRLVRC